MNAVADETTSLRRPQDANIEEGPSAQPPGAPRGTFGAASSRDGNSVPPEPAPAAASQCQAESLDDATERSSPAMQQTGSTTGYGSLGNDLESGERWCVSRIPREDARMSADDGSSGGGDSGTASSKGDSGTRERLADGSDGAHTHTSGQAAKTPPPSRGSGDGSASARSGGADSGGGGDTGDAGSSARRRTRRVRAWGPSPCCVYYRVGALSVVCEWRDSGGRKTRLFLGPYWPWLLATLTALSTVTCFVYLIVVPGVPWKLKGTGIGLSCLSLVLLLFTAMSDPGIFRRHARPMADDWTWSEVAQSYRPPGTVYCQESEVLIEGYDHFCPWSGTVIGKKNRTVFLCWIVVLVSALIFDLTLVVRFLMLNQAHER